MDSQATTSNCNEKNEIEGEGRDNKKLKQDNEARDQNEDKQSWFDNLPSEMLNEIFKKLNVSSLLSCRLLNRKCNALSCELLKSQALIKVEVDSTDEFVVKRNRKRLNEFMECFKKSKNFPCSRYQVEMMMDYHLFHDDSDDDDDDYGWNWNWNYGRHKVYENYFESFISCCGNSIKSFDFQLREISSDNVPKSVDYVRDLLLHQLPNLEEFGLLLDGDRTNKKFDYGLFEKTGDQVNPFQLPKIKVVRLSPSLFKQFPAVVKDLFEAAVNVKQVKMFFTEDQVEEYKIEQFKFLHSLGKLDLLQEAEISPSVELFSWMKDSFKLGNPVVFKLKKLTLNTCSILNEPSILSDATTYINQLFEDIKDTLIELLIEDLTFLDNLQLPKFIKVRKLSTSSTRSLEFLKAESFPALRELDLSDDFPSEPVHVVPSIKIVKVSDVNEDFIEELSKMYPNLIELEIVGALEYFSSVGPSIWTHMKKLESLSLDIYGDAEENSIASIVSALTGIRMETCDTILDNFKASEKPMSQSKELEAKNSLKMSEAEIEGIRENVSILDLKDLQRLSFELSMVSEVFQWYKLSVFDVCKMYAFDFMPKTTVTTRASGIY